MPSLQKLKTILQSNLFYVVLIIFISFFVLIKTIVIKYDTNYDNPKYLEGIIVDYDIKEDKINFTLDAKELVLCTYYLEEQKEIENLLGKKVIVKGNVSDNYNNTIPNTFNYKKYLYNKGIYLTYKVDEIRIIKDENIFYKIKNKMISHINSYDDKTKTYLNLFLLGDKNYLDSDTYNNYLSNGIWHLFAVSGMHISLLILIGDFILRRLKFKRTIISLLLSYFMFLTSFSASVLRAVIFYILKCLNDYFKLNISLVKLLLITASGILFINPFMIYNSGFQYSFLITLGIILMRKRITGNYFVKIFKISLLAFIISMPITINLNYEINLLSIFYNIFYVPFISLIIFPLSIITFIGPFLSNMLELLLTFLETTNNLITHWQLNLIMPKMSILFIIIYYLLLFLYYRFDRKRYFIIILLVLLLNYSLPKLDNNFYVYYLDVLQGDASIIISPKQKEIVMIDTGGSVYSSYHVSNNIIKFLKSLGITHIDYLIITHGDYDHAGEAINLVNNFKVEKVIFNNDSFNDLENNLVKELTKKKIKYYQNIGELNLSKYQLYFLNTKLYDNENDNSNVIYFIYNNFKFLFMGDASKIKEQDILNKYNIDHIDFYKVGHHGSKTATSNDFINSIEPKIAFISVGRNNRYGHPNQEVLNTLKDSQIYRTDLNGTIEVKIANNYVIKTFAP